MDGCSDSTAGQTSPTRFPSPASTVAAFLLHPGLLARNPEPQRLSRDNHTSYMEQQATQFTDRCTIPLRSNRLKEVSQPSTVDVPDASTSAAEAYMS